jgi:hypothetical protein
MRSAFAALVATTIAPVQAGTLNGLIFFSSIPTLDEVGLGILIALVAAVAGWAVRRRGRR